MEEAATVSPWLALLDGAREYRRRLAQALAAVRVLRAVNWKLAVLVSLFGFASAAVAEVPVATRARLGEHPDKTPSWSCRAVFPIGSSLLQTPIGS